MISKYVDYLFNHSFIKKERDTFLFSLIFDTRMQQSDVDKFFKDYNIEEEPHEFNVYLSNLLELRKELEIPKRFVPRLSGVRRWHHFHNISLLAEFRELVKHLNKNNIIPVIIKGASLRYYLKGIVRHMWDLDCMVEPCQYELTCKIANQTGWTLLEAPDHSSDFEKNNCHLDIHNGFIDNILTSTIFREAILLNLSGVKVYIPSIEHVFYICIINAYKNLTQKYTYHSNMTWAFDLAFILTSYPKLNLEEIKSIAKKQHNEYKLFIMLSLLNRVLPSEYNNKINSIIKSPDFEDIFEKYNYDLNITIAKFEIGKYRAFVKARKNRFSWIYIKYWVKYSIFRLCEKKQLPLFLSNTLIWAVIR